MNPFEWTGVVASRGMPGYWDEGSMTIVRRHARFDREALEAGAESYRLTKDFVDEVQAWAEDLDRLKASGASPRDLVAYLESAPPEAREAVLKGVLVLLDGWGDLELRAMKFFMDSEERLAVQIGSPADRNLPEISRHMRIPMERIARAPELEEAFESVMADYGIFEC